MGCCVNTSINRSAREQDLIHQVKDLKRILREETSRANGYGFFTSIVLSILLVILACGFPPSADPSPTCPPCPSCGPEPEKKQNFSSPASYQEPLIPHDAAPTLETITLEEIHDLQFRYFGDLELIDPYQSFK